MNKNETGGAYFIALGGGSNIGAKMLVLVFPREKMIFIFDCGIGMLPKNGNADNIYLSDLAKFAELMAMHPGFRVVLMLTHAHMDHIGGVPLLKKLYPQIEIRSTEPTAGVMEVMCRDSIKIRKGSDLPEHYTEDDLVRCIESIHIVRSADWIDLKHSGFMVRFEPAGHICGASTVLVKTPYGIFADSGDISFYDTTTVRGASKKLFDQVRWLSIESTNGDVSIEDPETVMSELVKATLDIKRNKGNSLIPGFANGRGPDVAIRLGRELQKYGINVWSGGLLRQVTESQSKAHWGSDRRFRYSYHRGKMGKPVFNLEPENVRWVHGYNFGDIVDSSGNVVVIPNGMVEAGYAQDFLSEWAGDRRNGIFIVGYQAEGTKGRELLGLKPGGKITLTSPINGHSEEITVNATVRQFRFSGHADGDQLADWVHRMNTHDGRSLDKMILVHGNPNGQEGLRQKALALPNSPKEILIGKNCEIIKL
ncbi:MBL fold metallo-hydrolase [Patescibacteria group bacterium]|nr:MBL fold metallo-hydrolase [Patescibacteria group bacterium]